MLNPELNFLTTRSPQVAAKDLANLNPGAPFAGIPFLVKEGVGVAGLPMTLGSRLTRDVFCDKDSELVRRLRRAGLITLGCTNIPEFTNATTTESKVYGPARNPWNPEYS